MRNSNSVPSSHYLDQDKSPIADWVGYEISCIEVELVMRFSYTVVLHWQASAVDKHVHVWTTFLFKGPLQRILASSNYHQPYSLSPTSLESTVTDLDAENLEVLWITCSTIDGPISRPGAR